MLSMSLMEMQLSVTRGAAEEQCPEGRGLTLDVRRRASEVPFGSWVLRTPGLAAELLTNSTRWLTLPALWLLLFWQISGRATELVLIPGSALETAEPAKPLVAWWRFDELDEEPCAEASGKGNNASLERGGGSGCHHVEGLFGRALSFSGQHLLRVPGGPDFRGQSKLSLTAWVRPTGFDRYNEIFRKEDGEQRVLFSFQENGTVLSLGLNISGYVECDAKLEPLEVLDGQWHHCAAAFDGEWMRVYLDGRQIGELNRPGPLVAGGSAPGCIGSSNGGECFQGAMDDLRIYADALTGAEVMSLFRRGQAGLERFARAHEERLAAVYVSGKSLIETLAQTHRKLHERQRTADRELVSAVIARARQRHTTEYSDFVRTTDVNLANYLQATNLAYNAHEAQRLLDLLLEYRPLTEAQWRQQNPAELQRWRDTEAREKKFAELKARGDEALCSPEWLELMLTIARGVQLRPYLQEAVAPYVQPKTPLTRTLSTAEARKALERDWLHQADQQPTPERIRSEIAWTRGLAKRLCQQSTPVPASPSGRPRDLPLNFAPELAELAALEQRALSLSGPDAELYYGVREVKRRIAFRNPLLDFTQVLFVDMPFPQGSEWPHETRHRLGYMAVPGGRLLVLDGLSPGGKLRQLLPQAPLHGSFWRPDLSFDARQVLVCFKPHNEKSFHLYEINIDGTGLRQLTDGPFDDLDPIYLADDQHIVFSTTRGNTYVRCMPPTSAFVLARCDRDGRNLFFISANNEPDYLPSLMDDGRVVYTRWEYTDKPLWRAQKLWTVYPDGTQVSMMWGNQSVRPDLLKDARNIPGTRRVMFTGSAHHDWFSGSVGIVTPDAGLNFPQGLAKITADVPWPECGNGPVDPVESPRYHRSGEYRAYYSPYPLSEQDFLVSANRGGKFVLYLMDVDGNRELIYEGSQNIFHALPLRSRPKPPVLPDAVAWPVVGQRAEPKDGILFSADIYQGAPASLRGKAKFLRVLSIDHKTYTYWHQRPYISTGPVVSGVQSDGVKRILGTVPIEADGSVAFRAPAGIPLHFQLLDADERALQTMRSFANVMPGESHGCLGCHELHCVTPPTTAQALALALAPREIKPPPWDDRTVSYPRYVRPVLDRYCGKCHTGEGEGRKKLDLTARPGFLDFDETYWLFTGHPSWGQPYQLPPNPPPGWGIADTLMVEGYGTTDPAAYRTPEPMKGLSYKSRLIDLASSGKHHEVKVDPVNLQRLILWVDTMCPYRGEEEIREIPDPEFQGVDWLAVHPRIKTAPLVFRPGPLN
jgi:hypothetical protein